MNTFDIENFPGFTQIGFLDHRHILMYICLQFWFFVVIGGPELMNQMKEQAEHCGVDIREEEVYLWIRSTLLY